MDYPVCRRKLLDYPPETPTTQKGAIEIAPDRSGFFSPMFYKEGWGHETHHKSEETELALVGATLQDGEHALSTSW